ncbi:MAG TPA: NAD(P)/FAD-dependent oxidoreductase, partial [bacterium]
MSDTRHLILGGGTAGVNAIRTLRQLGDTGEITLVSAEPPYSRMVLPYYLAGSIAESHATTAGPRQLERWGVQTRIGVRATRLDAAGKTLHLDNDETIGFENLLIATGSSALRPPVPGADALGVHTFWTMDDAQAVHRHIRPEHHVVLVGAGFIAFTILDGILARAAKLTIVEVEPRILPRMVDEAGAALAAAHLAAHGVTLRTGTRLTRIERRGDALHLTFDQGAPLSADLVLMATGIRPNIDWLRDSGLALGAGIKVDAHLRTSAPGIYAAGDVAEGANRVTGAMEVHAIEPTAMEHGRVAGANMAGRNVAYA